MRSSLLSIALVAFLGTSAYSRTWTSSDGAKTFEGELKSYDADSGIVTVLVNGRPVTFPKDKLSAADITFIEESAPSPDSASASDAASSVMSEKMSKVKLHLLDGKRFKKAELTKSPEFYVLYYSASWCPPCRAAAPDTVKKFMASIADNPKVEFIHVSADSSEDDAETWAAEEGFPWLTVVPDDVKRSDLMEFKTKNSVPHYVMVDSSGNLVANSSSEVFNKIAEVSKASQ
jgi:thiol-disulfide isomerase/thioredoxin